MSALIALLDDERGWVAAVGRTLAAEGYAVMLMSDADAAIDLVAERGPDVMILDPRLPRLDGRALAVVLHEELGEACPPLIGATRDLPGLSLRDRDGLVAVYEKPTAVDRVVREVRRMVQGRRQSGPIPAVDAPSNAEVG